MTFQIEFKSSAVKELRALPVSVQERVVEHIEDLAQTPRPSGSKKLAGSTSAYRIRVGMYRIVYELYDQKLIVLIIRIAHRKDVYR